MKMIQVTQSLGFGDPIWINVEHIVAVYAKDTELTIIDTTGSKGAFTIRESLDDVLDMLEV